MRAYCDYNATTPLRQEVKAAVIGALDLWHNPSSCSGCEAKAAIENARHQLAAAVSVKSDNVVFTSGGTEANHLALHSALESFNRAHCTPHVITTTIEHVAVRKPLQQWQQQGRCEVTFVSVEEASGAVTAEAVAAAIRENTRLVTVMMANNETGVVQPIHAIRKALEKVNIKRGANEQILFHTDAAQCLGKITVDANVADYTTIVGHKFYAPRIGALIAVHNAPVIPIFYGGGQERGLRPGTENTPMIVGLGCAAQLAKDDLKGAKENAQLRHVRDYFEAKLVKSIPKALVNFASSERLPNTSSVRFDIYGTAQELLSKCESFTASVGAACHSNVQRPSAVLVASGLTEEQVLRTVRFSFGIHTTEADIDAVLNDLGRHAL